MSILNTREIKKESYIPTTCVKEEILQIYNYLTYYSKSRDIGSVTNWTKKFQVNFQQTMTQNGDFHAWFMLESPGRTREPHIGGPGL